MYKHVSKKVKSNISITKYPKQGDIASVLWIYEGVKKVVKQQYSPRSDHLSRYIYIGENVGLSVRQHLLIVPSMATRGH